MSYISFRPGKSWKLKYLNTEWNKSLFAEKNVETMKQIQSVGPKNVLSLSLKMLKWYFKTLILLIKRLLN